MNALRDEGGDARIASDGFVVMTAEIAESFDRAASITASGSDGTVKISATGSTSTSGSTTYTLSAGTTFAYLLVKIDWDRGKDVIDDLNTDEWGL